MDVKGIGSYHSYQRQECETENVVIDVKSEKSHPAPIVPPLNGNVKEIMIEIFVSDGSRGKYKT